MGVISSWREVARRIERQRIAAAARDRIEKFAEIYPIDAVIAKAAGQIEKLDSETWPDAYQRALGLANVGELVNCFESILRTGYSPFPVDPPAKGLDGYYGGVAAILVAARRQLAQ